MTLQSRTQRRLGRKTHLAQALALALALGGGVATTAMASPGGMGQTQHISAAEQQAQQAQAARQAQRAADVARASAQPLAATVYVANCNNTGGGSLRDAIFHASSGDTIDMTTMSCNVINLSSAISVNHKDLTLVGKNRTFATFFNVPDTYIHSSVRAFYHSGTGTFTLRDIDLSDGHVTGLSGGCIFSFGNVTLDRSYVHDCVTKRSAGSPDDVKGGAIYAAGKVTLAATSGFPFTSSRVYDNVASAADGDAYGGGIYAGLWLQIKDHSSVYGNLAESTGGNASGGGLYGEGYVDLTKSSSSVHDNKAQTHAANTQIKGAGIYTEMGSRISGAVTGNEANTNTSVAVYIGQGGGIFAQGGVHAYSGANISDNHADRSSGGGIFTNDSLYMVQSTVADNSGLGTGAIFAKGDVTIKESTISGNRSRDSANIKLGPDATGDIVIQSSTISNNIITNTSKNGAALNLQHDAVIGNSTITGNVEINETESKYGAGAGISLDSNVHLDMTSTIVSGNFIEKTSNNLQASDIALADQQSGASLTGYRNLLGALHGVSEPTSTQRTQTPKLAPLADNGGPTETHEPCRDSVAISNGTPNSQANDQRGSGFARSMGVYVEIGAIEAPDYSGRIFRNGFEDGECSS